MSNILKPLVGTGAPWPIEITTKTDENGNPVNITDSRGINVECRGWYIVNDISLIKQNLSTIMESTLGFWLRNESLGTRLFEVIEEPNNQVYTHLVRKYVLEAITSLEPRVTVTNITSSIEQQKLNVAITFTINDSNISNTLTSEITL